MDFSFSFLLILGWWGIKCKFSFILLNVFPKCPYFKFFLRIVVKIKGRLQLLYRHESALIKYLQHSFFCAKSLNCAALVNKNFFLSFFLRLKSHQQVRFIKLEFDQFGIRCIISTRSYLRTFNTDELRRVKFELNV